MEETTNRISEELRTLPDQAQVRERRRELLASVRRQFQGLSALPPEDRRRVGQELNRLKAAIERVADERLRALEAEPRQDRAGFDPALPVPPLRLGRAHPTTTVLRRMNTFFHSLGFDVVDGPEIESDWYNFGALNLPPEHPAREMHDTIYIVEPELLLRTHTSSVEIRVMEQRRPPLRIVVPGKAYRYESVNATNHYMFFQYEGLVVERDISMAHLQFVLSSFLRFMFGEGVETRFRAKYYPQVEPGLGVDLRCQFCGGAGCGICKGKGWIEILGGGMAHPNVLASVGIDWEQYGGFAFGMGLDRLVMSATGIEDIRQLYGPRMSYIPEV
jgi:phenylalanyl-tRNA synthetase alpha chain